MNPITRRDFLWRSLQAGLALGVGSSLAAVSEGSAQDPEPKLIVRSARPLDLETPVEYLESAFTANDVFFVRSHLGEPAIDPENWRLEIGGLVKHPREFTLPELQRLPAVNLPATLQCAGNGRGYFNPPVPGAQWQRGAVGNALWTGVRLRDLLRKLSLYSGARHVHFRGYDLPPMPATPAFVRSIPIERAMDPTTILAFKMNREPLPTLHGGPLRLVVAGWAGNNWLKWLRQITVADREAPGFYMQTAYRMPPHPVAPGAPVTEPEISVAANPVKSLVVRPLQGARLRRGMQAIWGVAFTGAGVVERVQVSLDGGTSWKMAELAPPEFRGTWQRWRYQWNAEQAGEYTIAARATDSAGRAQPDITAWNHGGYLWNGVDRVRCVVA